MTSKIKMTTTAAEQVAGNSYLLEEILIRLPAKSLTRSKLVSKQWLSHISNPQLVQRHHSQQIPNKSHTGMFVTNSKSICRNADFVPFNDLNPTYRTIPSLGFLYDGIRDVSEIKIINSCNGLFLLSVSWKNLSPFPKYCVCNPTTKAFRLLPPGPRVQFSSNMEDYLAFDPRVSLSYKVICLRRHPFDSGAYGKLHIYSSEDQSWKIVPSSFSPYSYVKGFFLSGSIYWLSNEDTICFDVYKEEMKPFKVPPKNNPCVWTSLAVVGNHLYYLSRKRADGAADFLIREMSSDFSEWVTKYDGSVGPLLSAFPRISGLVTGLDFEMRIYSFSGICVVEGEKSPLLVLGIPDKVLLYNLEEKTAKEIYTFHGELGGDLGYRRARVFQFIETLLVV